MIDTNLGHWTEGALRNLPTEQGVWNGIKGRAYTYAVGHKILGTVRRMLNNIGWTARVDGFEWKITEDMGAARFLKIPGNTVTHVPVKLFVSSGAAKTEVESILANRPEM